MIEKKTAEKKGETKLKVIDGKVIPMKSAPAPIPFEKQKPLFGEMDRIVNVLEMEFESIQGEIGAGLKAIARKKEEVDALRDRASTVQSALADSKKFGKISAEEIEKADKAKKVEKPTTPPKPEPEKKKD